ncbi:MAG: hypothetical protein ACXVC1_08780 [Tumebacillaceae bacterium]
MSDKVKIKEMKIGLLLTPELRAALQSLATGQCEVAYLDDVYFEHLCIKKVKADGLKVEDIKLKRGCIKCFKIKAIAEC